MKNFFSAIGVVTLLAFGFFYKDQTTTVMKNMDDIMIHIKEESKKYEEEPIEAIVKKNTVIPGIIGRKIDVDKSYRAMKSVGYFNENLLEYKPVYPTFTLKENFNYYIIKGNSQKSMVSFLFQIDKNTSLEHIEEILNIAKIKNVNFTFFLDGYWFEENNDFVSELVRLKHDLGSLSYNGNYKDSSFLWMNTIIKKITEKKYSYCYMEEENNTYLDICSLHKNYTIKPSLNVSSNPYITIKEKIQKGDIVSFKITSNLLKELPSILSYIQNRGMQEVTITKLLQEELK